MYAPEQKAIHLVSTFMVVESESRLVPLFCGEEAIDCRFSRPCTKHLCHDAVERSRRVCRYKPLLLEGHVGGENFKIGEGVEVVLVTALQLVAHVVSLHCKPRYMPLPGGAGTISGVFEDDCWSRELPACPGTSRGDTEGSKDSLQRCLYLVRDEKERVCRGQVGYRANSCFGRFQFRMQAWASNGKRDDKLHDLG